VRPGLSKANQLKSAYFSEADDCDVDTWEKEIKSGFDMNTRSYMRVLFCWEGSVWPGVLPFCIFNAGLTFVILALRKYYGINLSVPDDGHKLMTTILSFLIVNRSSTSYKRYMEARHHLEDLYRSCREIIDCANIFSAHDQGPKAKAWRAEVAYRVIVTLRVTIAALEHLSSNVNTWDIEDLEPEMMESVRSRSIATVESSSPQKKTSSPQKPLQRENSATVTNVTRWSHGSRTVQDENYRAPIYLLYKLRESIVSHKAGLLKERLVVNEEREILVHVSEYMSAYEKLKVLQRTPFPFPLIQKTLTFLFFWVFTLPFALANDIQDTFQVMTIIFVITYGFCGLENISEQLDDPFGDDPNDFDDLGMAQFTFEDIYNTIIDVDGCEAALALRRKISSHGENDTTPLGLYRAQATCCYLLADEVPGNLE